MKKHPELTITRIQKFRNRLKGSYYTELTPMEARYVKSREPIGYHEVQKLKFSPISPGKKWGDTFDCAWFRFSGKVPEHFAGYEVVALVDIGGEACVFDKEGNPIQGLTNKRIEWTMKETIIKKRIYLFDVAEGGEEVELMVDAGANNILGVENVLTYESMEDGVFNEADLAIFDREKWYLYVEYDLLTNLMDELHETSRHKKLLIFALNQVINEYGEGTSDQVARCREILQTELEKPANASAIEAIAIGHAHIDIAWLWPLRETVRKAARTFSTALLLMEEYPDYKFGASQPHLYQMVKEAYPGLYERIKKAVARGQWECQGAMWVEADCNLSSGESLVRQIIHGKKFFKEEFGVEVNNLWLPDVFGYSAALPQLCIKSDVHYFMTQKISWNQFNTFPHHTFIWKGLDGTPIFSHFLAPNNYRSDVSSQDLINLERKNFDTDRNGYALFLYGAGDGGGGPSRIYIEKLRRAKSLEDLPKVKMAFAEEFFEKAAATSRDLQTWYGELYLELHRGTLTTHALTKKMNRKIEFLLRETEWLYAQYLPEKYPKAALDRLWKVLLLNQFHDIIPGTSITRVHQESLQQYEATAQELKALIQDCLVELTGKAFSEEATRTALFNSLSWEREEVIFLPFEAALEDEKGNLQPYQSVEGGTLTLAKAPALGHTTSGKLRKVAHSSHVKAMNASFSYLENDLIRVDFNEDDGTIARIYDKEADREVLAGDGNQLKIYEDRPNFWDAWDLDVFYEESQVERPALTSKEIAEEGPLRTAVRFQYASSLYTITQTVSLCVHTKRIDFHTKINWQETDKMLRAEFPVNIHAHQANFEIQYGYVQRPTHYNTSWDMAQFEVVAHKWADISQPNYGVAILNDCKYGHKIKSNVMSLNLLRSPKNPDPVADMHVHEFTYSLFPHVGDHIRGNVIREAYQLNIPIRVVGVTEGTKLPQNSSLLHIAPGNIIVEAVKHTEYGDDLILRLFEATGQDIKATIKLNIAAEKVLLVNLIERELEEIPHTDGAFQLYFKPFELHTVKVVRKGVKSPDKSLATLFTHT